MMKKVNVISRKLIKPCTPTPLHLTKYKISFLDELSPPINTNVILFYHDAPKTITQLEESLANILPRFYPLAGRYIETDRSVDCNDEGAEFVLAEALDIELDDLTGKNDDLLSRQFYEVDGPTDPLLSIQITRLVECGELAIGISVSHRIFDASSLATFVSAWSNANINGGGNDTIAPSFDSPSLFPGRNLEHGFNRLKTRGDPNIVVKRVVFSKEDIGKLRSKIIAKVFVSRVRLVSAFIAKAIMRMDRAKKSEKRGGRCFKIIQPVNIRARTTPPLHEHSCGNLVVSSVARVCMDEHGEDVRFEDVIYKLGEAIGKTIAVIEETLGLGKEGRHQVISDSVVNMRGVSADVPLMFTDWSKFGFYEADLGWGDPVLVGFGNAALQYATKLMDNGKGGGGGIEAWVNVKQADLPCFERFVHLSEMESEDF